MPSVKLVAPDGGPRVLPDLAGTGLPDVVQHGDTIDVSPELAGEPPRWRRLTGEDDPLGPEADPVGWRSGFHEYREHAGHQEVYDLGYGLLAQVGIWEPVKASAPQKTED